MERRHSKNPELVLSGYAPGFCNNQIFRDLYIGGGTLNPRINDESVY